MIKLILMALLCASCDRVAEYRVPVATQTIEQERAAGRQAYADRELQCSLKPCGRLEMPAIKYQSAWVCVCVGDREAAFRSLGNGFREWDLRRAAREDQ